MRRVYGQSCIEMLHERRKLKSSGLSCTIQYRKQNVEILELYVQIEKSKNELFEMSYILIFGYILIILAQSSLRINPGQVQNDQTFLISLVSVKSIEKVTSTQVTKSNQVQEYCNWRKEALFRL